MQSKASVLMTAEGTYPYYPGGVSVWCDQLITNLPEFKYHILAVTHAPNLPVRFPFPANVDSCTAIPLWGTEEPGWYDGNFAARYQRILATTAEALAVRFAQPFQIAVGELLAGPDSNEELLAESLHSLYRFFQEFDYATALESEVAWRIFLGAVRRRLPASTQPNLDEATTQMRWLTRYMAVFSAPLPVVDLVHGSFAGLAGATGVIAKLEHGSAFLLSEHGIFLRELYLSLGRMKATEANRRFLLNLNTAIVRMNYRYADTITSLGEFNSNWQTRFGAPAEKIEYFANGVDPSRFSPEGRKKQERPTVVTLARISPIKGIDTLARAAALVRQSIPNVRFVVYGDVADEKYFAQVKQILSENGMEGSFEFGGLLSDPTGAYLEADVFCLPSNTEGMPYSILEAMLSGCPVVATDVGNVKETVADTGLVVRPNQPGQLAEALVWMLEAGAGEQRRRTLAGKGLQRALSRYTIERMANRCRELYSQVIRDNHTGFLETTDCYAGRQIACTAAGGR